jgi:hypothetical protein
VTAVTIPVLEDWWGKATKGETARAERLRQAMLAAQRELVDRYGTNLPTTLHVAWFVLLDGQEYAWSPIDPVPHGATHLSLRATVELWQI